MKFNKEILIMAVLSVMTGAILTSCNSSAQRVENAEDNVEAANKELDDANKAYLADMENYRKETADKIAANEESIAAFKARIANEKKDARANYEKQIAELEQKNTDMKKTLDDYKAEGKEQWELFKMDFNRNMDKLGQAFKDFTNNHKN